jgi:uncharacterized protein
MTPMSLQEQTTAGNCPTIKMSKCQKETLMFPAMVRSVRRALVAIAIIGVPALHSSTAMAQAAGAAPTMSAAAVDAARELLMVNGYRAAAEAKMPIAAEQMKQAVDMDPVLRLSGVDVRQMALRVMHEREPALIGAVAKLYAARFTVDELRQATKFYHTPTGRHFAEFCLHYTPDPRNPGHAAQEVARNFSAEERAAVWSFTNSALGKKLGTAELDQATRKISGAWGQWIGGQIERALRTGATRKSNV